MQGIHSNFFSLVRTFGSSYDSMTADCCVGATARAYVMTGVRHVVGSCLTCVCWVFLDTVSGFQSVVLVVFWCKKGDVPWDFQLCAYCMARWYITWKRTQKYHKFCDVLVVLSTQFYTKYYRNWQINPLDKWPLFGPLWQMTPFCLRCLTPWRHQMRTTLLKYLRDIVIAINLIRYWY